MRARWLVALLLTALLASACGAATTTPGAASPAPSGPASAIAAHQVPLGATAPVDDATWALAERLTEDTYTADTTGAMQTALARAGIAVVADASTDPGTDAPEVSLTGPRSPFELLDFQAHALAVGAWGGAGWTGAELDSVVPLPAGLSGEAPTSVLLAAYVAAVATPGAALARALMAGQDLRDPATARFPAVVFVLFVSDLVTDGGRLAGPSASPSGAAGRTELLSLAAPDAAPVKLAVAVDTVCSDTANWMKGMLDGLFNALKLATPDNVPGAIVASIWNWIVDVAHTLVNNLIASVTAAVMGTIRSIGAAIAAVAEQVATFLPYAVKVIASGGNSGAAGFQLGSVPLRGTFTAVVSAGDLPSLPAVLTDCAKTVDVDVPDFRAKQVPVTWGPIESLPDPLLAPIDSAATNTVTDDTGTTTWGFLTSRDPGDPTGEPVGQLDTMPIAVHRPEIEQARTKLTDALLGWIPPLVKPFVLALFAPYLDGLEGRLNALLDARGTGTVDLKYHEKAPPTPSPSTTPSGSGACAVTQPAATDQGSLTIKSTTIIPPGQIDLGEHGGENDAGSAPLSVAVGADGSLSGQFTLTSQNHFEAQGISQGTEDTTVVENGSVGGTLCALALRFLNETITACKATGVQAELGCGPVNTTIDLTGLMPAEPLGAPTVSGKTFTWSISYENGFDAGFGGLGGEVQSTLTMTLTAP
jgi:hypothetical protein